MDLNFWQLLLAAEVAPSKGRALIEAFGPCDVVSAEAFAASPLLAAGEAARVRACDTAAAAASGAKVVHGTDRPALLAALEDAPIAFFALGDATCLYGPCVAIVGTRNASAYGKAVAKRFASELALAGATVVSGGALGIDAAAHEGALAENGRTAAVLAGGLDKPYPTRNAGLFRRICEAGCLVSTYACGMIPERHKFLERNDVIAGLSQAVLVVEAPATSGALTTAFAARRFERAVFVVPATIDAESFRGSHALVRSGATLVDDPGQLISALGLVRHERLRALSPTTEIAARILGALSTVAMPAEKLATLTDLSPQELLGELTMLELDGRVIRDSGGYALVP